MYRLWSLAPGSYFKSHLLDALAARASHRTYHESRVLIEPFWCALIHKKRLVIPFGTLAKISGG